MSQTKFSLLLTATVDPGQMPLVRRRDPKVREADYRWVLEKTLALYRYPIVFCENSLWDLTSLRTSVPNADRALVEFLQCDGRRAPAARGKGYAELNLMRAALDTSTRLRESDYIIKITGRYFLKNLERLLRGIAKDSPLVLVEPHPKSGGLDPNIQLETPERSFPSGVFIFKRDFFDRYLWPRVDGVSDSQGHFLEHALFDAVRQAGADGKVCRVLPARPELDGYSGTLDTPLKKMTPPAYRWRVFLYNRLGRPALTAIADIQNNLLQNGSVLGYHFAASARTVTRTLPRCIAIAGQPVGPRLRRNTARHRGFVTFEQTPEGLGGVLGRYLAALVFAERTGSSYAHTPIGDFKRDPTLNWERFLSLGAGYPTASAIESEAIPRVSLPETPYASAFELALMKTASQRVLRSRSALFVLKRYTFIEARFARVEYAAVLPRIRERYWAARAESPAESGFHPGRVRIAVHVRRAEIESLRKQKHWQSNGRYSSIEWYETALATLRKRIKGPLDIQLFSDAENADEFTALAGQKDVRIHLRKDNPFQPFRAFHAFAEADICLCAPSSFSYFAAVVSHGWIIVPEKAVIARQILWNERWVPASTDGRFDILRIPAVFGSQT